MKRIYIMESLCRIGRWKFHSTYYTFKDNHSPFHHHANTPIAYPYPESPQQCRSGALFIPSHRRRYRDFPYWSTTCLSPWHSSSQGCLFKLLSLGAWRWGGPSARGERWKRQAQSVPGVQDPKVLFKGGSLQCFCVVYFVQLQHIVPCFQVISSLYR